MAEESQSVVRSRLSGSKETKNQTSEGHHTLGSVLEDDHETNYPKMTISSHTRWGQHFSALIIIVMIIAFIHSLAVNKNMQWSSVLHYLGNHAILSGLGVTLELTIISQLIALVIGVTIALMMHSLNRVHRTLAQGYIFIFRGTPLLVQLLFWYNIALIFPTASIGIPFTHVVFVHTSTNLLISGLTASLLGLGLNEGAYMAEIIRGGILAVPKGQFDAGLSLGMSRRTIFKKIVLPQTVRTVIPPTGNQFIGLLKASSLVSVIGGNDLLTRAEYIYGQNFEVIPLLIVASIWYLILTSIATIAQHYLELRIDPDRERATDQSQRSRSTNARLLRSRLVSNLFSRRTGQRV